MKWYLIKSGFIILSLFLTMGLIGNIIGLITFTISSKLRKSIDDFLKISIWISFFVGLIGFVIMGMFYATYALSLTTYITKWLAISLVLVLILIIIFYSRKEYLALSKKTIHFNYGDFQFNRVSKPYANHSQVVNQSILSSYPFLIISYVIFLIFNDWADKFSFGLSSYLMSFIN